MMDYFEITRMISNSMAGLIDANYAFLDRIEKLEARIEALERGAQGPMLPSPPEPPQ